MKNILLSVTMFIWQLPQHIVAGIVFIYVWFQKGVVSTDNCCGKPVILTRFNWGVSLGQFIMLGQSRNNDEGITVRHEYGHSLQSEMLGPLYLLVVGIPSAAFNNLWDQIFHKRWSYAQRIKWYYNRYPEKWADALGKVRRFSYLK